MDYVAYGVWVNSIHGMKLGVVMKSINFKNIVFILTVLVLPQAKAVVSPEGVFKKNCYMQNDDAISEQIQVLQLNPNEQKWNHTYMAYEDEACAKMYLKYEINYLAQLTPGKTDGFSIVSNVDFKVQSVVYTALTKSVAHSLNYIGFCGYTKWTALTPVDVTGLNCQDVQQLAKDHVIYSTVQFNSSSTELNDIVSLQIGQPTPDEFGETPETRLKSMSDVYLK